MHPARFWRLPDVVLWCSMGLLHLAHANIPFIHERSWKYSIRYLRNRHDIQVQRQTKQVWMPWMKLLQNITHTHTHVLSPWHRHRPSPHFERRFLPHFPKYVESIGRASATLSSGVRTIIAHSHRIKSPSLPSSPSWKFHHSILPWGIATSCYIPILKLLFDGLEIGLT